MTFTVIRELCSNASTLKSDIIIDFCQTLEKLRSLGFDNEVEIIENLVSILLLRIIDSYSSSSLYI